MIDVNEKLTDTDRIALSAAMDRMVPAVDDLPGAGEMGLANEVVKIAEQIPRYAVSLMRVIDALRLDPATRVSGGFMALESDQQVESLKAIESSLAADFNQFTNLIYLAYYSDARVHRRIGWRTGPLQPLGWVLPPFDEKILETVSKRKPFWRKV